MRQRHFAELFHRRRMRRGIFHGTFTSLDFGELGRGGMRRGIFAELLALLVTVDIVAVASYSTYYKELPPWSPLGWASKQLKR